VQLLAFAARNGSGDKGTISGQFTEAAYHRLLVQRHGNKSYLKGLSTLVPRMYTERACFGDAGILTAAPGEDGKPLLRRARAQLEKGLFPAYALLLFLLWDTRYSTDKQLAFDELARDRRLLALLGWDVTQATEWLDLDSKPRVGSARSVYRQCGAAAPR
jgi:hypothetical protein